MLTLWRSRLTLDEIRIRCHNEYDADALFKFSLEMSEDLVTSLLSTMRIVMRDVRSAIVTDNNTLLDQKYISAVLRLPAIEEFGLKWRMRLMPSAGSAGQFEGAQGPDGFVPPAQFHVGGGDTLYAGVVHPRGIGISGLVKRAYRKSIRRLSIRGSSP